MNTRSPYIRVKIYVLTFQITNVTYTITSVKIRARYESILILKYFSYESVYILKQICNLNTIKDKILILFIICVVIM